MENNKIIFINAPILAAPFFKYESFVSLHWYRRT